MRCPFCLNANTMVKDSRSNDDNFTIKRRRICENCKSRFTTFEKIHLKELTVIKSANNEQRFEREKLVRSLDLALRKRPVSNETKEKIINNIIYKLEKSNENKISSKEIGKLMLEELIAVDKVGYVRFASVYMNFTNIKDFENIMKKIVEF
ncbi:transcriptional repressor NrdR [Anaplasmataceae bacterium AB001_6]|nr:transcriptional repressor NrdR [Anaplasmataceae bacterium AB001_6]